MPYLPADIGAFGYAFGLGIAFAVLTFYEARVCLSTGTGLWNTQPNFVVRIMVWLLAEFRVTWKLWQERRGRG